jgi:hypothetical protein
MDMISALKQILTAPNPTALWELYGCLLARGTPDDSPVVETVHAFHQYLCELRGKATARQFSELASLFDIGAVGSVALENLVGQDSHQLMQRFFIGAAAESLMVVASRQYIKGWQAELHSVHCQAAWFVAAAFWRWSARLQPGLTTEERWQTINQLLAPVHNPDTPNDAKAILLAHLFQILLIGHLAPLLHTLES